MKPTRRLKLDDYIVITISLICTLSFFGWVLLEVWTPKRSLNQTHNLTLLWSSVVKNDYNNIIFNDENIIIYADKELKAFDLETGDINWQTSIPSPLIITQNAEHIFVTSGKRLDDAPMGNEQKFPRCGFGNASLSAYDSDSGHLLWGYTYQDVFPDTLVINGQRAYLQGYANHATARSFSEIDVEDGGLLFHDCTTDIRKREIPLVRQHQSFPVYKRPYRIVIDNTFLFSTNNLLTFVDKNSARKMGWASFGGVRLSDYQTTSFFAEDNVVLYLEDSDQIFVFRFDSGEQ